MAEKTPTARGTAGFVEPQQGVYGGAVSATNNLLTDTDQHHNNRQALNLSIFHFADIDNGDTWTSGIPGIVALAWQPEDATDDAVRPTLVTLSSGLIGFLSVNADSAGWLWVLHST